MPKKPPTLIIRIPLASLEVLSLAAFEQLQSATEENKFTREIQRAIATAERAIKIAKLKKGIFE